MHRGLAGLSMTLLSAWGPWTLAQDTSRRIEDFTNDPHWEGHRSRLLPSPLPITRQDFGWRDTLHADGTRGEIGGWIQRSLRPACTTARAGGKSGEIGGIIWRDERPAYYAGRVGPLTLADELFASGRIAFNGAGSDSGVYLGWFNSMSKTNKTTSDHQEPQSNVLAVLLEGPSKVGHYFRAAYNTARGHGVIQDAGPIVRPDGCVHQWSIHYAPKSGQITVQLDGERSVLAVSPEHVKQGALFDRFGLFNLQVGGHFVEIVLDDLTYTVKSKAN